MERLMSAAFCLGVVLIAAGAGLAWPPAGLLVAGVSLIVTSILHTRGSWVDRSRADS
jgi:hypothetical protein